ncbi:MAG: prolipoprotein diacylglyceryl transferase, partial [Gammaproteobacteria bacterium]|nr:prolipoprotein diacylglyceryl transferase [Gammaproteobacteria bacterium]
HIGYLAGEWLTMGQLLSVPMIMLGGILLVIAYKQQSRSEKQKSEK